MCENSKLAPTINNLVKYTSIDNSDALQPSKCHCKKKKKNLTDWNSLFHTKFFQTTQEEGLGAFLPPLIT